MESTFPAMGWKGGCGNCCLSIKTRIDLFYLRVEIRPGSPPRPGPYFACLWDSSLLTGGAPPVFLRGPSVAPAPPAVPLPRCRWEPPAIRGRWGPSRPTCPYHPHLRKTHLLRKLLRNLFQGVSPPAKGQHFAQVRGLPWGWDIRSLPLPVDSRGGYPPAPPPRPEQGRAQCVPVGRRAASPLFGFATSPALRSFAAPRPGRLRPAAGSATAPPSIWCGACAPEADGPSARPPWHR